MDRYRVELRATLAITLAGQDAETGPVPTSGGGYLPEPVQDRLSNILRAFSDQFPISPGRSSSDGGSVTIALPALTRYHSTTPSDGTGPGDRVRRGPLWPP
jgi:hypothetical protein